ncbi:MAG: hypothetical protein WA421_09095 [Nitrososphaeraceae archaeon]
MLSIIVSTLLMISNMKPSSAGFNAFWSIAKVSLKIPTSDIKESKSFPVKQDTISISNNQNISKQVPSKHLSINGGKVITRHSVNNETAQIESSNKVINHIPVANAGKDRSIFEHTNHVMLKGTGRDPDHDTISYSWEQVTGDPVILRDANNPTMTFNAPAVVGEKLLTFKLAVSDGKGGQDTDDVKIRIRDKPEAKDLINHQNYRDSVPASIIVNGTSTSSVY